MQRLKSILLSDKIPDKLQVIYNFFAKHNSATYFWRKHFGFLNEAATRYSSASTQTIFRPCSPSMSVDEAAITVLNLPPGALNRS